MNAGDENLWLLLQKGGAFMYPLAVLSVISLTLILERTYFYTSRRYSVRKILSKTQLSTPETLGNNPLAQVAKKYCHDLDAGETHCINLAQREAAIQITQHERGIKMLATIGAISPLIGLLGTVWGMVQAFAKIAKLADSVSPSDFAGGIWIGLLTTVAGLLVAIPAVFAARIFEGKVDKLTQNLNELASHLKELYSTKRSN